MAKNIFHESRYNLVNAAIIDIASKRRGAYILQHNSKLKHRAMYMHLVFKGQLHLFLLIAFSINSGKKK